MADPFPQLRDGAQTVFFKVGGEWCFLRTPDGYASGSGPIPCVIQCHGNSGLVRDGEFLVSTTDTLDDRGESIFVRTLVDAGIEFGQPTRRGLDERIAVVPVSLVKGLEVDAALVVEPSRIVREQDQGMRALYVALTRATKRLTILHSEALPSVLVG